MIKHKINTAVQATVFNWVFHMLYKNMQTKYQLAQEWLAKATQAYFDEQIILADEIIKENSRLYSYNFLGSPQSLFSVPGRTKEQYNQNLFTGKPSYTFSSASVARVVQLDRYRYELIINGNTDDLRVNIYDEARELVVSEQITSKGSFSRMYDLKWTKVASVFLEVENKNGIILSRQF